MFARLKQKTAERTFVTAEGGQRVCFLQIFIAHIVPETATEKRIVNRCLASVIIGFILLIAGFAVGKLFHLGIDVLIPVWLLGELARQLLLLPVTAKCIALPRGLSIRLYAAVVEPEILRQRRNAMTGGAALMVLGCFFWPKAISPWLFLFLTIAIAAKEGYAFILSQRSAIDSIAEF